MLTACFVSQVKSISGPKASMKDQGELQGVLADLGYTAEQVRSAHPALTAFGLRLQATLSSERIADAPSICHAQVYKF